MHSNLEKYNSLHNKSYTKIAAEVENYLKQILQGEDRIDRIQSRAKSPKRFLDKSIKANEDGTPKYNDPFNEIQDIIGARIITFYLSDVERVQKIIEKYFRNIERKMLTPDSSTSFGYFGYHYILSTPKDIKTKIENCPDVFELQIKTLFQHAWSEANHDLGYKEMSSPLTDDDKRRMAWASAQAWGADQIFNDLFNSEKSLGK